MTIKPHAMPIGLKIMTGSAWLIGARFFTKIIDLLTLFFLARLLSPQDFGLVAIAMTSIYIFESMLEMPLMTALVRLPKIDEEHIDTAFTLSIIRGLIISVFFILLAHPYGNFYQDPKLILLISALSLAPAARGISSPNLVHQIKAISFSKIILTDALGKFFAAIISIITALVIQNYWAIALYTILSPAISAVISFVVAPYRPRITVVAWRDFLRFLGWNTLGQFLTAVCWQFDRLILGMMVTPAEFGRYTMANDIAALPEQSIVKPILSPILAGFVAANRNIAELRISYCKTDTTIFLIGLPIMLGLSAMAGVTVKIGLGDKWLDTIPMIRWLALSFALPLAAVPLSALVNALDQPQALVRRATIEFLIKIPLVLFSSILGGIYGAIYARLVSDTLVMFVSMSIVRSLIGLPISDQLRGLWRPAISGLLMYTILIFMDKYLIEETGFVLLISGFLVMSIGVLFYILSILMLWIICGRPEGLEKRLLEMARK